MRDPVNPSVFYINQNHKKTLFWKNYIEQLDFINFKMAVFNDLKKTYITRILLKDLEIEKCACERCFDYQT